MEKDNKKKKFKLINGTKGAISLFLAVLMTPFLTIAMILVEVGRYNSAVSVLDEAMGSSAISLMANYDQYLHDRWGLLAVTQAKDPNALYGEYLTQNIGVMGGALTLNSATMNGAMPLSDLGILRRQIMEYSKLNVPVSLATNFLNISSLLNVFEGLGNLDKYLKVISTGVDVATASIDLAKNIDKLKESANKLDGYAAEYNGKYESFRDSVNPLIDSLSTIEKLKADKSVKDGELAVLREELAELLAEEAENSSDDDEKKEESQAVKDKRQEISDKEEEIRLIQEDINKENNKLSGLRSSASTAKDNYAEFAGNVSAELRNYKTLMGDVDKALETLESSVVSGVGQVIELGGTIANKEKDLEKKKKELEGLEPSSKEYTAKQNEINTLDQEIADLKLEKEIFGTVSDSVKTTTSEWDTASDEYDAAKIELAATGFSNLKTKLNSLNINSLTSGSAKITADVYKNPLITAYSDAEELDKYIEDQEKKLKEGTLGGLLKGLTTIYETIMGIDGIYENDLNAVINTGYYDTFGGLPGGEAAENSIITFFRKLNETFEAIKTLGQDFMTGKWLELWEDIKNVFECAKAAFLELVDAITEPIQKIVSFLTEGYEPIYLTTYASYMTTCRTDYNDVDNAPSFSTIGNYSVPSSAFPVKSNNIELGKLGDLGALIDTVVNIASGGKDLNFRGAELEYMLAGTTSELANQALTFLELYILRILCCLPSISSNAEVLALAGAATIGSPAVMALYYICEPLVQTVLLCNGSSVEFIPSKLYLTPSGLPGLLTELTSYCKLTAEQKKKIETDMVEGFGADKKKYDEEKKKHEAEKNKNNNSNTNKEPSKKSAFEKRFDSYKQGLLKFNYRDYCFFIMLLFVKNDAIVARLSNLIQMESHLYYKQKQEEASAGPSAGNAYTYDFTLYKSYTFVDATADVKVEQILPSLTDSSLFELERRNYRGY